MNRIYLPLVLFFLQLISPTLAQTVLNISTSQAEGRTGNIPKVTVWQGSGLSLNFISTGEQIVRAWLDDPSKLTLDFDVPISNSSNSATVIHLRQIKPLNFANLPSSASTLLTVVTKNQTLKVYYFKLYYGGKEEPKYIAVNINKDSRPFLQKRQRLETSTREKLEKVEKGLKIAKEQSTDKQNDLVFERVETLLGEVKGGLSFNEAMRRHNLAPSVLDTLETLANSSAEDN